MGAEAAVGDVLVFLDAHRWAMILGMECVWQTFRPSRYP